MGQPPSSSSSSSSPSDCGVGRGAITALASAELFPHITSFLRGVPVWVVEYEAKHEPTCVTKPSLGVPGVLPRLAIQRRGMDVLKRLHQLYQQPQFRRNSKFCFMRATRDAVSCGNLTALQWLFQTIDAACHTFDLTIAAEQGDAAMVQCLISQPNFAVSSTMNRAFECAGASGEVAILRLFHAANWSHSHRVMDRAAASGHLDAVIFLHELHYECTSAAADQAAANGHLQVLKWLLTKTRSPPRR